MPIIEQRHQPPGADIFSDVEPRLVRDAMPGQRPAAGDFAVVAEVVEPVAARRSILRFVV